MDDAWSLSRGVRSVCCITRGTLWLYRDSAGVVHAFGAWCPHRGCDLSLGWVCDDALVCLFHGWRFYTSGRCIIIPAQPASAKVPRQARLIARPIVDAAGLTWLYTGDGTPEAGPIAFARVHFDVTWHLLLTRHRERCGRLTPAI